LTKLGLLEEIPSFSKQIVVFSDPHFQIRKFPLKQHLSLNLIKAKADLLYFDK
jgi:hypothetical protein